MNSCFLPRNPNPDFMAYYIIPKSNWLVVVYSSHPQRWIKPQRLLGFLRFHVCFTYKHHKKKRWRITSFNLKHLLLWCFLNPSQNKGAHEHPLELSPPTQQSPPGWHYLYCRESLCCWTINFHLPRLHPGWILRRSKTSQFTLISWQSFQQKQWWLHKRCHEKIPIPNHLPSSSCRNGTHNRPIFRGYFTHVYI